MYVLTDYDVTCNDADFRVQAITIYRFYIRCTRCSAELTFKTDPSMCNLFPYHLQYSHYDTENMDYTCEKGAKRNFEPWREAKLAEENEEERLDRLEREAAEHDAMKELETKTLDAKTEMAIADKLDEIRTRNARLERADRGGDVSFVRDEIDHERERQEAEDAEAAKLAFMTGTGERVRRLQEEEEDEQAPNLVSPSIGDATNTIAALTPGESSTPAFARIKKKKKDFAAALGIKKKVAS